MKNGEAQARPHEDERYGMVYDELGDDEWYGGGIDLTPSYVVEEDCTYFHEELSRLCGKLNWVAQMMWGGVTFIGFHF